MKRGAAHSHVAAARPFWAAIAQAALAVVVVALLASGCSVASPPGASSANAPITTSYEDMSDPVWVFAASSLTNAFVDLAAAFEQMNPGIDVELNFGASSGLREQILDGAPADVFAAASELVMADLVRQESTFDGPVNFASNQLVLAAPAAGPTASDGLSALEDASLFVGLCASEVPCGQLAEATLADLGIEPQIDTYEPNARALTNRLIDGELDLGLIYATDATAAGSLLAVVEVLSTSANRYPIAARTRAGQLFVDYVTSEAGQAILATWGFGTP